MGKRFCLAHFQFRHDSTKATKSSFCRTFVLSQMARGMGIRAMIELNPDFAVAFNPTLETLLRMAHAIGVDFTDVIQRASQAAAKDKARR